ncbi:MAG: NAD(P)/FAD-dependent oxidoreductase [Archaeoglobaceae archaeon]|nr:NAD(P)/FAD-dependent oxidoreductase [Archaeoglobaceae archaeon]MCX8151495.1 NAD(P)/FAD-dependent oxidoreductase [Archaeoglobaceae archaeon]MDW8014029.1 NAD(P)/FAD-dependent oxidoreductase [Archaeoglobaceae archaeon]
MKVAVIGAGLTGLTAAYNLKDYANVKVYEANEVGGLLASFCPNYCIEKFYHHCFKWDKELILLLKDLNLLSKLFWKTVKVGFAVNGKIYSLSNIIEIIKYPYLTLKEKAKLAFFTLKSKKRKDYEKYDEVYAIDGLKIEVGDSLLEKFFLPLLNAKFGENAQKISYAWLLARVSIRSNRNLKGEKIGYLRGGFKQLIDKLSEDLEIVEEFAEIKKFGKWQVNGEDFDAVVYTAPLDNLNFLQIRKIKYQSTVCALLALKRSLSDVYWVNSIGTPFGAIIEHTNFAPLKDYGEHLVYLVTYCSQQSEIFRMSENRIRDIFMNSLRKFGICEKDLNWIRIFKAKYSGPVYEVGFAKNITPYKISDGFYIAGMTSKPNYPERSMNGSIKAGREVAEVLLKDYQLIIK